MKTSQETTGAETLIELRDNQERNKAETKKGFIAAILLHGLKYKHNIS